MSNAHVMCRMLAQKGIERTPDQMEDQMVAIALDLQAKDEAKNETLRRGYVELAVRLMYERINELQPLAPCEE